jgi:PAS domain S-box-containing protein
MGVDRGTGESRGENRVLRDFAPLPYQSLNPVGEVITVNTAWIETLGYQLDEVTGQWFGEFLADEYKDHFEENFANFKSEGELTNAEFKMQCADGETINVSFEGIIEYNEDGSVNRTHCQFQDITEQKEKEAKYRNLFEDSRDALMIFDRDGYIDCNDQALNLFGLDSVTDILESTPWALSPEKQPDGRDSTTAADEHIETAFEEGDAFFEWTHQRIDGTTFPSEVKLSRFEYGDKTALLALIRDITERKEHEQELKQRNQQLDRFASIVSHDLRNPLNVAFGRLELARAECETPHHEQIETSLNRIRTIIDDTLTLSRLGKAVEDTQETDLETQINRCWDGVETGASTLDGPSEARRIQADPDRLRHVFENIFRNAVEHGGEDVTVRIDLLEGGFAVSDDGPGLPDGVDIFETGETTSAEGTGFGLSIVEEIVNAHGWEIHATESEAGGARFEITGVEFVGE